MNVTSKLIGGDRPTTIWGVLLGILQGYNVDLNAVANLDPAETGKLFGAVVTVILLWRANKKIADTKE